MDWVLWLFWSVLNKINTLFQILFWKGGRHPPSRINHTSDYFQFAGASCTSCFGHSTLVHSHTQCTLFLWPSVTSPAPLPYSFSQIHMSTKFISTVNSITILIVYLWCYLSHTLSVISVPQRLPETCWWAAEHPGKKSQQTSPRFKCYSTILHNLVFFTTRGKTVHTSVVDNPQGLKFQILLQILIFSNSNK